jgi:hypothetical protein
MLSSSLSVREASPCVKQNIMLYISGGRIRLATGGGQTNEQERMERAIALAATCEASWRRRPISLFESLISL